MPSSTQNDLFQRTLAFGVVYIRFNLGSVPYPEQVGRHSTHSLAVSVTILIHLRGFSFTFEVERQLDKSEGTTRELQV